jgi:hypothetical protein
MKSRRASAGFFVSDHAGANDGFERAVHGRNCAVHGFTDDTRSSRHCWQA